MMALNEIKKNLCYNDLRNPNAAAIYEETAKEIAENNADCYCDNCFRGKTALAEELLKYYRLQEEVAKMLVENRRNYKTPMTPFELLSKWDKIRELK